MATTRSSAAKRKMMGAVGLESHSVPEPTTPPEPSSPGYDPENPGYGEVKYEPTSPPYDPGMSSYQPDAPTYQSDAGGAPTYQSDAPTYQSDGGARYQPQSPTNPPYESRAPQEPAYQSGPSSSYNQGHYSQPPHHGGYQPAYAPRSPSYRPPPPPPSDYYGGGGGGPGWHQPPPPRQSRPPQNDRRPRGYGPNISFFCGIPRREWERAGFHPPLRRGEDTRAYFHDNPM